MSYSIKQIKAMLNQARYEGRILSISENQELLERWYCSFKHNRERLEQCLDSDLQGFILGVQYRAICDDRSCDFCSRHNGEALEIDDLRIQDNTPPIHLGCRCMWSPVTKFAVERSEIEFKWSSIEKPDFGTVTL